ncbi:phosphohistidine phosphatase SixA [Sulfolobus sp. A20]|uniref:phosphohistidine phosphatase SixA n=1 Tax=Saccharolobus sp. A20 TaxID=1891280 RepID=UPI0008461770|nr:phosphohistidine phosphatase SixA [Sulfolobus sp. A20]TRM83319.1 phosphohistidine phosphatase SixA [Sulfolobus sp. A20-N-F6]TRM93407.1 phosphohistidine phosphatase SixA [Sulfolobus sp. A20-N-G8]TRN00781.1 phosphohistidine phosphatase SixA [Sulfolobus sp. F1]TRN03867.1 phosphohistidine phosphatase SixA [Sulfolobus sp. E1]AOL17277.1 phosphohistidine phosphatase SixA [Sulfolobus sp. A20]
MLNLIIVRHGEAEPQVDGVNDKDRKLIKKGIKQMRRIANFLDEMDYTIDRVMTSTLIRAYQSAEIILDELGEDDKKIESLEELNPDKDPMEFLGKLKEMDNSTLLIVGHEPYLSQLIKSISGGNVEIKKGGLAIVEYDSKEGRGQLKLLLNQKVLKLV